MVGMVVSMMRVGGEDNKSGDEDVERVWPEKREEGSGDGRDHQSSEEWWG